MKNDRYADIIRDLDRAFRRAQTCPDLTHKGAVEVLDSIQAATLVLALASSNQPTNQQENK